MDMRPVTFSGITATLSAPLDWDDDLGECQSLPVMVRDGVSISCWRAGWLDRLRFLWHGHVYLHVVGGQPPVMLVIDR